MDNEQSFYGKSAKNVEIGQDVKGSLRDRASDGGGSPNR
jgi:hypothetical protein